MSIVAVDREARGTIGCTGTQCTKKSIEYAAYEFSSSFFSHTLIHYSSIVRQMNDLLSRAPPISRPSQMHFLVLQGDAIDCVRRKRKFPVAAGRIGTVPL